MRFIVVKQPEVTWREIWDVRWMLKLHDPPKTPTYPSQAEFYGPSVIVKNSHTFTDGTLSPLFIVLIYCSKAASGIILPCYSLALGKHI